MHKKKMRKSYRLWQSLLLVGVVSLVCLGWQGVAYAADVTASDEPEVITLAEPVPSADGVISPDITEGHTDVADSGSPAEDLKPPVKVDLDTTTIGSDKDKVNNGSIIIRKYAKDDKRKLLQNAMLELYQKTDGGDVLFQQESFKGTYVSDDQGLKLKLPPGTYILKEKTPPPGYKKAPDITFVVEQDGIVTVNGQVVAKESEKTFSYEAFTDWSVTNKLGTAESYGKEFYIRYGDPVKREVVYCFNADLKQPLQSESGTGEDIDYANEPLTEGQPFKFMKMDSLADLPRYTAGAQDADPVFFREKIKRVLFAGYPHLKTPIVFKNQTEVGKRAATQLAIYHYTDQNLDVIRQIIKAGGEFHGFERYGEDVLNDAQRLVNFAESTEMIDGLDVFDFNFYVSSHPRVQSLIGSLYHPEDLFYVVRMEDELGNDEVAEEKTGEGGESKSEEAISIGGVTFSTTSEPGRDGSLIAILSGDKKRQEDKAPIQQAEPKAPEASMEQNQTSNATTSAKDVVTQEKIDQYKIEKQKNDTTVIHDKTLPKTGQPRAVFNYGLMACLILLGAAFRRKVC